MMPVLMPLRDGHEIHPDVLRGILGQSVETRLIPVSRPGTGGKYPAQARVRNLLLASLVKHSGEHAAMIDRDKMLTDMRALERAVSLLSMDDKLKVVHLRTKDYYTPSHYDMGAMVFKREIISRVLFDIERRACNCQTLTDALDACDWHQTWLTGEENLQGKEIYYGG